MLEVGALKKSWKKIFATSLLPVSQGLGSDLVFLWFENMRREKGNM